MMSLRQISKIYRIGEIETVALDKVSFEVEDGEFVAIMGPSGSGKSTLMHIIGALDRPTSGEYVLNGKSIEKLDEDELAEIRNKQIGFVFQAFNLLPRTSALKNVMLPMAYGGVDAKHRLEAATKYLNMVGLGDRLSNTSSQLSGGQQQRVAIARSLVMNPAIILADEPTGNIASNQAEEIMAIFQQLNDEKHTIVMITHEPDIALHARRTIVIRDGKLVEDKRNKNQRRIKLNKTKQS